MTNDTRVLYNETCPVCRFEIHHYRDYADSKALPIAFDDLMTGDLTVWGLTQDDAAKRLHVLHQGQIIAGIPAFLVLWEQMPRYRWLGKVVGLPGIKQIAYICYDHLLAPVIYAWHLRRLKRQIEITE